MEPNETQMVILVDNLDEKTTKSAYVAQVIDLYKTGGPFVIGKGFNLSKFPTCNKMIVLIQAAYLLCVTLQHPSIIKLC